MPPPSLEREPSGAAPPSPATRLRLAARPARILPWAAWLIYTPAWTASLLTTPPVTIGQKVLPHGLLWICSKCLHVSAYALWAVLSGWLHLRRPQRWYLLLFLSAHGLATEYLQRFVRGRYPSWRDVGLDHLGLLIGVACTWRWWFTANSADKAH